MERARPTDPWTAHHQNLLRRRFANALAYLKYFEPKDFADPGLDLAGRYAILAKTPHGMLGLVGEPALERAEASEHLASLEAAVAALEGTGSKSERAFPWLMKGVRLLRLGRDGEAVRSLERSVEIHPHRKNPAVMALLRYHSERGHREAFFAVGNRYFLGRTVDPATAAELQRLAAPLLR
jgi:TPR repeat protein